MRSSDLRQLRRLYAFTRPYRKELAIGMVAVTIASFLAFAFPLLTRELFNNAFDAEVQEVSSLNTLVLILFGVFLVQAGFNYLRVFYLAKVGEGVVADLRDALYSHLIGLPLRFFESRKTGEITSRLTSDITAVQGMVSLSLAQFVNQLITLVGGMVVLFILSWQLSLVMLSVIPAVILAAAFFGRKLRKISTEFQDKVADANASAEEAITGIRVVQSFNAENFERARYRGLVQDSYRMAIHRAQVRAVFVPTVIMAMFSGISLVLWYGGRLLIEGSLAGGDLIAFLMLTVFVAGSINTFTSLYSQVQEAIGASTRIFELLDEKTTLPEPAAPAKLKRLRGAVRFDNVSFRYEGRDEEVLRGVTLEARPSEVVALVGPSGAGKSTLISLVPRFYDATGGRILVDGTDVRDMTLNSLRRHIGIVPQETQLFSGTIADNILYGRPEASLKELEAAAHAANAYDFVTAFPDGFDTVVGERGVKLSGGQRQRIAIARALLKDPRILILDEATSSLDSESEALVQEALETLMKGRTVFVIAHRLSTVRNANVILVLEGGRIVQRGDHEALLKAGGLYRELYEKQFRHEDERILSS